MSAERANASRSSSSSTSGLRFSAPCVNNDDDDDDSRKGSCSDTSCSDSVTSASCHSAATCDICALVPSSLAFAIDDKSCSHREESCQHDEQKAIEEIDQYRVLNHQLPGRQRVYLVRSAHRLDHTDPNWIELSQLNQDNYLPISIDFPIKLPRRRNNRRDYALDPPLSEFGQLTGQIVGRELRLQGVDIRHIFASPALSCVQTAVAIIKGYRTDLEICIEPGLADYPDSSSLMTPHELRAVGYPIDANYLSQFVDETDEQPRQQYERIGSVVRSILDRVEQHDDNGGSTLIIANALAIDAMCRSLQKRGFMTALVSETALNAYFPACGALGLERTQGKSTAYSIVTHAVRPITHLNATNAVNLPFAERV